MTTDPSTDPDDTMPEAPEAPETGTLDTDLPLDEPDQGGDPETPSHEDPDPETLVHAEDADEEVLAGRLDAGPLEGREDGRLLD